MKKSIIPILLIGFLTLGCSLTTVGVPVTGNQPVTAIQAAQATVSDTATSTLTSMITSTTPAGSSAATTSAPTETLTPSREPSQASPSRAASSTPAATSIPAASATSGAQATGSAADTPTAAATFTAGAPSVTQPVITPGAGTSIYLVQQGDTLSAIASRFSVSLSSLLSANPGLDPNGALVAGQSINIPSGAALVPSLSVYPGYTTPGSTVTLVAVAFGPSVRLNIFLGQLGGAYHQVATLTTDPSGNASQKITIPAQSTPNQPYVFIAQQADKPSTGAISNQFILTGGTANPAQNATPAAASGGVPVTGATSTAASAFFDTVRLGESIGDVAFRHFTTIANLLQLNPSINPNGTIRTGQTIQVPNNPRPSGAWVNLSINSARPGDTIRVRAINFPANSSVDVRIGRQGQNFTGVTDAHADAQGNVNASIKIPNSASSGDVWVVMVVTTDREGATSANSETITITQ